MRVGAGWIAVLCSVALLLPAFAAADPIAGSTSQVGAWRVAAYTRGKTTSSTIAHSTACRARASASPSATRRRGLDDGRRGAGLGPRGQRFLHRHHPGRRCSVLHFHGPGVRRSHHGVQRRTRDLRPTEVGLQLTVAVNQSATPSASWHRSGRPARAGMRTPVRRCRNCADDTPATGTVIRGLVAGVRDSTQLVAAIQVLLTRLGYDPGSITGEVGLKTNMAISAFQKSQGERGDGRRSEAVRATARESRGRARLRPAQ